MFRKICLTAISATKPTAAELTKHRPPSRVVMSVFSREEKVQQINYCVSLFQQLF